MSAGSHPLDDDLNALEDYQKEPYVHPLTCGHDSTHPLLEPIIMNNVLYLWCPECDYRQKVDSDLLAMARNTNAYYAKLREGGML
ncbi:MAG: hypothetical protein KGI50_01400 [Patescibacteria group bacterium]|nr:hypothetical protein [Patescibacteria group bacterium]MDE2437996.1 hypothetical protein [Patescibacteria group bacterium]